MSACVYHLGIDSKDCFECKREERKLRDRFADTAMGAFVAANLMVTGGGVEIFGFGGDDEAAGASYDIAEAMLRERNRRLE